MSSPTPPPPTVNNVSRIFAVYKPLNYQRLKTIAIQLACLIPWLTRLSWAFRSMRWPPRRWPPRGWPARSPQKLAGWLGGRQGWDSGWLFSTLLQVASSRRFADGRQTSSTMACSLQHQGGGPGLPPGLVQECTASLVMVPAQVWSRRDHTGRGKQEGQCSPPGNLRHRERDPRTHSG